MDLSAKFVRTLNTAIKVLDPQNREHLDFIHEIKARISKIMALCESSECFISSTITKIQDANRTCQDIVYVRKDGDIKAVVSRDVQNPTIDEVEKLSIDCECLFQPFEHFEKSGGYFVIDTERKLREIDANLTEAVIGIFDHDYRSYEGFTCFIGIYIQQGFIYIIDAVKFRAIIPRLRLLTCEVKKIFCSQRDVQRIIKDFGKIGCYANFNIPEDSVFIDWRIRPLNETLCCIICETLTRTVEKVNLRLIMEKHEISPHNKVDDFVEYYNLGGNLRDLVVDLIDFRDYLARKNDESEQYIITDSQLYTLIINMPNNVNEFESLFERMSSILRLHVSDFILVLNRKSKSFSLENLKCRSRENNPVEDTVIETEEYLRCFERTNKYTE